MSVMRVPFASSPLGDSRMFTIEIAGLSGAPAVRTGQRTLQVAYDKLSALMRTLGSQGIKV